MALVALAIMGAYQGWRRGAAEADVTAASDGMLPATNSVAARQALALSEPSAPTLTEAQIRTIARQEAQAAIRGPAPSEPSEPGEPGRAPASSRPAPSSDRPAAAASPAPTPAPAPAPAGDQAPPPPLY